MEQVMNMPTELYLMLRLEAHGAVYLLCHRPRPSCCGA